MWIWECSHTQLTSSEAETFFLGGPWSSGPESTAEVGEQPILPKAGSKQTDHSGSSLEVTVMPCGNAPCSSPAQKCRFSLSCNRNFPLPVSLWNLVNSCFLPVPVFGPMCHMLLDVLSVFRVSPQASYDQGNAFILDALLLRSTYLCILTYNCDKVNN